MKIGTYKLEYGGWYPPTVRQYVQTRVETLAKIVGKNLGSRYEVKVKRAKNSESTYLRIRDRYDNVMTTVCFRNHGNCARSSYDIQVLLYKYDTWSDCKDDFLTNILPGVLAELKTVKWSEKQITNTIVAEMTRALAETGATLQEVE